MQTSTLFNDVIHALIEELPIVIPFLPNDLGITQNGGERRFEFMGHIVKNVSPAHLAPSSDPGHAQSWISGYRSGRSCH